MRQHIRAFNPLKTESMTRTFSMMELVVPTTHKARGLEAAVTLRISTLRMVGGEWTAAHAAIIDEVDRHSPADVRPGQKRQRAGRTP
jgi:hypothetical protein